MGWCDKEIRLLWIKKNSEFHTKKEQKNLLPWRCKLNVYWLELLVSVVENFIKKKIQVEKKTLFVLHSIWFLHFSVPKLSFFFLFSSSYIILQSLMTFSVRWFNFVCVVSIADNEQTQNIQHYYGFTLMSDTVATEAGVWDVFLYRTNVVSISIRQKHLLPHAFLLFSVSFRFFLLSLFKPANELKTTQKHKYIHSTMNAVEQCLWRKCTSFCVQRCMKNDFFFSNEKPRRRRRRRQQRWYKRKINIEISRFCRFQFGEYTRCVVQYLTLVRRRHISTLGCNLRKNVWSA